MTEIQNDSITELIKNLKYICWLTKGTPRILKAMNNLIGSMILFN